MKTRAAHFNGTNPSGGCRLCGGSFQPWNASWAAWLEQTLTSLQQVPFLSSHLVTFCLSLRCTRVYVLHGAQMSLAFKFQGIAGTQGLAPHYDDVDLWVCQTEGTKRWRLYPNRKGYELPAASSPDFDQGEIGKPIMDVTLEVLVACLPAAQWHALGASDNEDMCVFSLRSCHDDCAGWRCSLHAEGHSPPGSCQQGCFLSRHHFDLPTLGHGRFRPNPGPGTLLVFYISYLLTSQVSSA